MARKGKKVRKAGSQRGTKRQRKDKINNNGTCRSEQNPQEDVESYPKSASHFLSWCICILLQCEAQEHHIALDQ